MARLRNTEADAARARRVETLAERGFELLDEGANEKALNIARQLQQLRWSGGFEIEARALAGLERFEEAISCLERGVEVAPSAWPNWLLLGSYLSDRGDFSLAERAYEQALACEDCDRDSITLNCAILANRRNEPKRALQLASDLEDSTLGSHAASLRMRALELLGRAPEAIEVGLREIATGRAARSGKMDELVSQIAHLRILNGDDPEETRSFLRRYWSVEVDSPHLLAAFRELDGIRAEVGCGYFRLLVQADLLAGHPEASGARGYFATFHVVAPDAKQGLGFLVRLLGEAAELRVAESKRLELRSEGLQGVYWCKPGRTYFAYP